ncbi:hypothetical protein [Massilia sp. TSP1-1-2]|uniref:hypothetical protein n=1 Tax=unclassified Massilia TaxID=2609279 RepID=UPI003CF6B0D6
MNNPIIADITVKLKLLTTERGGRAEALPGGEYRGILSARGQHFSFRCELPRETGFELGASRTLEVEFLFPDLALPFFKHNDEFNLWETGTVGYGRVLKVHRQF